VPVRRGRRELAPWVGPIEMASKCCQGGFH
jgi:hypothetical protein